MNEIRIGCENCTRCFSGCSNPFPEKFIEEGAEKCGEFNDEKDLKKVYANMERYVDEAREKLAKDGIYV